MPSCAQALSGTRHRGRARAKRRCWRRQAGPPIGSWRAIVGAAGLKPTLEAVRQGTLTALANKECLVSAGDIFMAEVARAKATLLPVDSEHSAAMQVMAGARPERIERICLTASGGPFRNLEPRCDEDGAAGAGAQSSQLVDGAEGHRSIRRPS